MKSLNAIATLGAANALRNDAVKCCNQAVIDVSAVRANVNAILEQPSIKDAVPVNEQIDLGLALADLDLIIEKLRSIRNHVKP